MLATVWGSGGVLLCEAPVRAQAPSTTSMGNKAIRDDNRGRRRVMTKRASLELFHLQTEPQGEKFVTGCPRW